MTKQATAEPSTELITLEQVEDVLLHGGDFKPVSEDEIQADMVRRILAAGTIEEAFQSFKATPLDAIVGALVEVGGIAWLRSAFDEGPKVYGLLKVQLVNDWAGAGAAGDELTVSMGGRTTLAAFVWCQRNAAMPFRGSFHREASHANPGRSFIVFKLA